MFRASQSYRPDVSIIVKHCRAHGPKCSIVTLTFLESPLKITHVGPDSQFLQFASEIFESVAPGANEYIIVAGAREGPLRFPIRKGSVRFVPSVKRGLGRLLGDVHGSDMVIAHMMTPHAAIAFLSVQRGAIKVWSGWGADYYGSDQSAHAGLLEESTRALSTTLENESDKSNRFVTLKDRFESRVMRRLIHGAAAKSDYFSASIPSDLSVFKKRFPEFHGEFQQIDYYSVDKDFACVADSAGGVNIQVGNSATLTNNHLEIFHHLSNLDISGRRIVVPLSYGNPEYLNAILARGRKLFGAAFTPLVDFMPLDAYLSIVASCNVVIMNHKREQALGNIGAALYRGAHVFLNEASPTLEFFRARGAYIKATSELKTTGLPIVSIPTDAISTNRRILETYWGSEQVTKNVVALISQLKPESPS